MPRTAVKRIGYGVLGTVGVVLIAAAAVGLFVAPQRIEEKLVAVGKRHGLTLKVENVQLGFGGFTLSGVRLERGAVTAHLDAVHVNADLWQLWQGDRSAVEALRVDGGRVRVDLAGSNRDASNQADEPPARSFLDQLPPVDVQGLRLSVVRGESTLATLGPTRATLRGADLNVQSENVELHGGSFEVHLHTLKLTADASTRKVLGVETSGGQLRVAEASGGLAQAIGQLEHLVQGADTSDDGPSQARPEPAVRMGAGLAPDAVLRMTDLEIVYPADRQGVRLASGIEVLVELEEGTSVHSTGQGSSESGGRFHWDLSLDRDTRALTGDIAFDEFPMAGLIPVLPGLPWHEPEKTSASWNLHLTQAGPAAPIAFDGRLLVRDAAFASPRLAASPVRFLPVSLAGAGTLDLLRGRLDVEEGAVELGAAKARVRGWLQRGAGAWATDLRMDLSPIPCSDALSAIPEDLLGNLSGFGFSGTLSGSLHAVVDSQQLQSADLSIRVSEACRFDAVPNVADLRRFEAPFQHRVQEPDGEWFEMITGPGSGNWTSVYQFSPFLVHAVLAHEDASFFRHDGFAPWAIRDALVKNLQAGRFAYGASTISMQLAKNLFLRREKTLARKVQEVLLTWWLEEALEKEDILELYLNVIEYGRALYGIRRAAWHYFGRDPADLSPAEGAFLASALPSPKTTYQHYLDGRLSSGARNRVRRLLVQMHRRGRINDAALQYGLDELDHFHFRGEGEGRAAARVLVGATQRLPYEAAGFGFWGAEDPFSVEEENPYETGSDDADQWSTGDPW